MLLISLPLLAQAEPVLIAGGDHDYPPYEFLDASGRPIGMNVELMQAVARELGRDIRVQLGPWELSRQAIAAGQIDLLSMYRADFRADDVLFATPHVIIYHEIFIRRGDPALTGLAQLAGREVIVQRGAWVHEQLIDIDLKAEFVLVETEREALELLASGRHDAALISESLGRRVIQDLNITALTTSGPPLFPVEYALAVPADRHELLADIDRALDRIKASGEFNRLHQRWLGHATSRQPDPPKASRLAGLLLALLLGLLIAGALAWVLHQRSVLRPGKPGRDRWHQDNLTGLANRFGLERKLKRLLSQPRTMPTHALLYLDLDQFRLINEHSDHSLGDEILVEAARLIEARLPPGCFLSRPGGDEFCLIYPAASSQEALAKAEQLRDLLEHHAFGSRDTPLKITVSIGVSLLERQDMSIGDVLKQAEIACLAAKEAGRNRVHLYHDEDEAISQLHGQMRWVAEVDQALKDDRLALYFQTIEPAWPEPEAGIRIELLLRMTDSTGRLVSAGEFVPAAEKYFLAHRIDRRVLRLAFEWLAQHAACLPRLERVYINISARSLGDDRFLPFVLDLFKNHAVRPELIGFEMTETAVMTHFNTALSTIERLRELGCAFALDDFGVGSSSVAYLKQLPVDVLKIDGSFSHAAARDPRERAVLEEINSLGHVLGKTTVAEMVETDQMRQVMADIGIDHVQGWAISKPRPLNELLQPG